jgi:hypothetical protein
VPIARVRVAQFARAIPQSASTASHDLQAENILPKSTHGTKLWASQNIFAGHFNFGFSKYGHIQGKPLCSGPGRRHGRQAHGSTCLAPRHHVRCPWDFLGLVNISMTSLVRNNERCSAFSPAVPQAFLEVSDLWSQFESVYLWYSKFSTAAHTVLNLVCRIYPSTVLEYGVPISSM